MSRERLGGVDFNGESCRQSFMLSGSVEYRLYACIRSKQFLYVLVGIE